MFEISQYCITLATNRVPPSATFQYTAVSLYIQGFAIWMIKDEWPALTINQYARFARNPYKSTRLSVTGKMKLLPHSASSFECSALVLNWLLLNARKELVRGLLLVLGKRCRGRTVKVLVHRLGLDVVLRGEKNIPSDLQLRLKLKPCGGWDLYFTLSLFF